MTEQHTDPCPRCGHQFNPHLMVPTGQTPFDGGVILCQHKGCGCFATWDVPQLGGRREDIRVPDEGELAELRANFQE